MANDLLTIDVDASALLAAMDRLGSEAERFTKPAARVTADNIADEARRRVAWATGKTAEGITVVEDYIRVGYVVRADRSERNKVPVWLEFGTEQMTARPFFFASARLEEGAHERRMFEAIRDAIDAAGLGE